jgi:hypothetical protein
MNKRLLSVSTLCVTTCGLVLLVACDTGAGGAGGGGGGSGGSGGSSINLNVVKLNVQATTGRGPAVGDGVLAFDAEGGTVLAWLSAGQTQAKTVTAPAGMDHDRSAFAFAGKKLVVRDRLSGSLFVFDTATEQARATASASINMGGSGGPNLWETEGTLIATVNSTVTTQNGAGKRIKLVDISNINAFVVTPFGVDPTNTPAAIDLDAVGGTVVVRGGDTFYLYDINSPNDPPTQFTRSVLLGGTGSSDVQIDGNFVAFFDDDDNFTLLDTTLGTFSQPSRNPGRENRGLALESNRFAYFTLQNTDDGGGVSVINRALGGSTSNVSSLIDPAGTFVNLINENDGRVGFGATLGLSANGRFLFVAGETAVGVNDQERLYLSVDGADFLPVDDDDDLLKVLRAAGVAASDNLVAFLIPANLIMTTSSVSIGYATLPPP